MTRIAGNHLRRKNYKSCKETNSAKITNPKGCINKIKESETI